MIITDPVMLRKMEKALGGDKGLYTLDDIDNALASGKMQSHVVDDTWIITQVFDFPSKRVVNILYVVGDLGSSIKAEQNIVEWAKGKGANMLTSTGREGWWKFKTPGWEKVGVVYSKDISHG